MYSSTSATLLRNGIPTLPTIVSPTASLDEFLRHIGLTHCLAKFYKIGIHNISDLMHLSQVDFLNYGLMLDEAQRILDALNRFHILFSVFFVQIEFISKILVKNFSKYIFRITDLINFSLKIVSLENKSHFKPFKYILLYRFQVFFLNNSFFCRPMTTLQRANDMPEPCFIQPSKHPSVYSPRMIDSSPTFGGKIKSGFFV